MSQSMTEPTRWHTLSQDSDQPGHPSCLIRDFAVHLKKVWVLSYPQSAQRRHWSKSSLRTCHFVGFVMLQYYRNDRTDMPGQTVQTQIRLLLEANSADPDQTAPRGKQCRPRSDCSLRQTVQTQIRLLLEANSADPDQTAPREAVWSGSTLFAIPSASFGLITLW